MNDKELIGKVHSAVYHQCQRRVYAAPVDVLMEIGVLPKHTKIALPSSTQKATKSKAKFEDNALKYSSFRPLNKEHFIRGSAKSLGAKYTKERIKARLEKMAVTRQKNATRQRNTLHFPKRKNQLSKTIPTALSSTPLMKNLQKIPA